MDGDLIIYNENILKREFALSGYNAIWTENETNEWLMQEEDGVVTSCSRTGGRKGWQLFSISRWNKKDGDRLQKLLEKEFIENKNTKIYWDDVAMFCYPDQFTLGIREMNKEDVIEIDNLSELMEADRSYREAYYE